MAVTHGDGKYYGEPIKYDPDYQGPSKHRSCTDVLCLLLLIVFVGCWIGIGAYAFLQGDPNVMLVPKDSNGARCGLDSHVINKPYLFFFDLTKCLQPIPFTGCRTPQVCVEKCPDQQFLLDSVSYYNPDEMICVNGVSKPRTRQAAVDLVNSGKCARWYILSKPVLKRCLYNVADRRLLNLDIGRVRGDEVKLMQHHLKSENTWLALVVQNAIGVFTNNDHIFQKRCVPNIFKEYDLSDLSEMNPNITFDNLEKSKTTIKLITKAEQVGSNVVDDIITSWWKIGLGLLFAMIACILYIVLMRWIAGIMVWISIFGVIAVLSFCVYFSTKKYLYFKNNPDNIEFQEASSQFEAYLAMKETWLVVLIITSVLLAIILLVLLFLRKRIMLAIALIKEASRAVSSTTSALFFPLFPWALQIGVVVFAVSVGLYLSTIGDPQYRVKDLSPDTCICTGPAALYKNGDKCDPNIFWNNCRNVKDYQPCTEASCHFNGSSNANYITYLHVYNVFGFFWLLFFVSALSEMVLAGTFATWYWTYRKSDVPFFTVTGAILRTLRYHIGTLAFGSLIIAICRMIRVILEYIDSKLKKYENPCTKAVLCCCKCFCWCLENFLKFINRNAYIMCAIHGKNFCTSAKDAFNLLMRNIIRVVVLDKVTDFLIFLSKVLVTAGVTCVAYAIFVTDIVEFVDQSELNYNYVPVIIIGIGTFFIATVFFSVFTMAVDTLFLCFLEDSERNDGSREKPYVMSKNLMKILGKKNKRN